MAILMKVLHMNLTFGIVLSELNKFLSKLKCKVSTFMLIKEFTRSHSPTHTAHVFVFLECVTATERQNGGLLLDTCCLYTTETVTYF